MSQIPFVNQLGDALEAAMEREAARSAVADAPAARPKRRRLGWRRGALLLAVVAAAGATAAFAHTFQSSTTLVAGGIACYEGTGTNASAYYNVEANGRTPEAACKRVFRTEGPAWLAGSGVSLVACADPHGYVAVFRDSGAAGQCGAQGMSRLQARSYAAAQSSVDRLVQALAQIGNSRACIRPATLVGDVQGELQRLGWHGWQARLQPLPGEQGQCGMYEGTGSSFSDPTASLDTANRTVWVVAGPIPSLIALTAPLDLKLLHASARYCHTPAGARALVRRMVGSADVSIDFALTQEPRGMQVAYAQRAYDRGCTIVGSLTAAPKGRVVRAWLNSKSAPPPSSGVWPGGSQLPQPQ
jgi:hypothetical protein